MKMKNIRVALLACMVALFAVSCEKDAEENESPAFSGNRFKVEIASFRDANNSKAYLNYTDALSRIIYESGDKVQINGKSFTLSYEDGEWYANADNGQPYTGKTLYTAYCDGTLNEWDSNASGGPKYNFNINDYLDNNTHNKIILCGTSNSGSAITLSPACAILRVYTGAGGSTWTNVRVGFEGNKIPASGTIRPATGVITPSTYLQGVSQSGSSINGDFLAMRWSKQSSAEGSHASSEQGYWYVAIPIPGESVTTTLYLGWNNGSDVQHKTQGQVTLQKGYVYTVGTERSTPFTAQGYTKAYFKTAASHAVAFSAGNLQARRVMRGLLNFVNEWQLASSQTTSLKSANTLAGENGVWLDLFGYGTSGDLASAQPNSNSTTAGDYPSGNISGSNYDWGVKNYSSPGIIYGSTTVTDIQWRTLTKDEWEYLIDSRPGKVGLATVTIDAISYKGLVLLPDYNEMAGSWSMPDGASFNASVSSYSANTFSSSEWSVLENAGAVFLPVTNNRTGNTVNGTDEGHYWTSTGGAGNPGNKSWALKITAGSVSVVATTRPTGCAVRLVATAF